MTRDEYARSSPVINEAFKAAEEVMAPWAARLAFTAGFNAALELIATWMDENLPEDTDTNP